MCRLLAMTSNIETDLEFSFEKLCQVAKKNSHKHGWGVAWLENDELRLEKDAGHLGLSAFRFFISL